MMGRTLISALLLAAGATTYIVAPRDAQAATARRASPAAADLLALDTLLGRSGLLRARFLPEREARALELTIGALRVSPTSSSLESRLAALRVLPIVPFEFKVGGWVGMYRMGFWPAEKSAARTAAYENPQGFIEVTPANQDLRVSEHFRLRDFVTKDQFSVWPKYVVLREALIDKLELVIAELNVMGYPVRRFTVMSGFRHPFYNAQGVGVGGRARESRHQYGDASDVFPDNDADSVMDDLDGDGRVTALDADLVILAVERVEIAHPELTGGVGRYHGRHAHGPFVHIDVRGTAARWGGA
jgi:hypothetical protein